MGLFTRKKRDPPPGATLTPPPSHPGAYPPPSPNSLVIPLDQRSTTSDQSTKSRSPKPPSSSRFHNIFRSTSHSEPVPTHSIATLPPLPRQSLSDHSAPPAGGRDARGHVANPVRNHPTSDGSWDDAGTPLRERPSLHLESPSHLEPLDRYRQFRGGGHAASTVSLPAAYGEDPDARRRISTSTARETINETIYPVASKSHGDERSEPGGGKWSRWKMGRGGSKQRTGSMSSMRMFGGGEFSNGNGNNDGEDGGFVVTSFRTVSRVHEDPIASTSPVSPPLPSLPSGSALSAYEREESQQQESIRASIDLGSSQTRRPPLNVLPNNSSSNSGSSGRYNFGDRAPSPSTISVEAFRLASARSKSSVSLVSLNVDSPPLDNDRPKFEPVQRPSSRASRRQSTYSDLGVDTGSAFLPPRPRFAHHSNSSNSSLQSRKSSNHSMGGSQTPPVAQTPPSEAYDLNPSESFMSINSFTTAAEPLTTPTSARSTPAVSRVASPSAKSPSTSPYALPASLNQTGSTIPVPVRPAAVKRLSSGDSELRWIASYADSITSSEITTSPVAYQNPPLPFPAPRESKTSPVSTPKGKSGPSRISHTPSFSVQPPTPATVSDSSPSGSPATSRSPTSTRQYPKRSSSLANDATKAALRSMGVGDSPRRQSTSAVSKPSPTSIKSNKKAARAASRGWMSDSSDEDEQEALETDNSNSDSDDEVPLSQIRSRSQTDLSLPPALVQAEQRARAELEAVAVLPKPAVQAAESKLTGGGAGGAGGGGSTLGLARRGSNRRSVSTLSLATSAMAMPTMTAAASSTPSSPTRSILQRPHHPRSVSNPNTPFPTSSNVSAPPPVPALPAGVADRSSSSSGTGSSSSALLTPGDLSPAVSDLGLKSHPGIPHLSKPSVKFDLAALSSQSDAGRWNKGRRASAIHSSQSNLGSHLNLHRPTQSLQPSFTPQGFPRAASLAPTRGPRSSLAPSPSSNSMASSRTAVEGAAAAPGSVYDRMKARHKQEAVEALKIGADLNHPSGLVPETVDDDDDDEDEDEPLANLPTRGGAGSMIGGMDMGGGSMIGGMHSPYGAMGPNVGVGFGGTYSPLAIAPFGVDPYLYASLPLDQKMSLHQRSQQMMAMMQQAAIQASVVAGSAIGGAASREGSMLGGESGMRGGGGAGPRGRLHGASMSMSNLDSFAAGQPQFNPGARLPPFAPTFAMSSAFMQPGVPAHHHQHSGSVYQVPTYANSALGFSPALGARGGSTLGGPTNSKGLNPGGRAASMMGFDQRR